MNWKIDWEDIDRRSKARRKKCHEPNSELDDSRTAEEVHEVGIPPRIWKRTDESMSELNGEVVSGQLM
jgi:hypothetical protein